ncbi:hypothetical protein [Aliidiomarina quisquiliarum]|uniref:hypothetical protein n=1 Tax=Aliidiomarina quisquiliarum TaxID=2938947 RepID=UPI00208EE692|nr:hypothetical protein [Aliidiomarina quisquiliarum]MCO4320367.1 hypothetical protein [Aliidiomarina quisquiliarum]
MRSAIQAKQARKITDTAVFGTKQALHKAYSVISFAAQRGLPNTSVTFDRRTLSDSEFAPVIPALEQDGYSVKLSRTEQHLRIEVAW